jgi:hypothetical protein
MQIIEDAVGDNIPLAQAIEELRRLASSVKRGDSGQTLNPTALVNEAWVKLANSPDFAAASHLHFKRIAARAGRGNLLGKRSLDRLILLRQRAPEPVDIVLWKWWLL